MVDDLGPTLAVLGGLGPATAGVGGEAGGILLDATKRFQDWPLDRRELLSMAISYDLDCATELSVAEVAKRLEEIGRDLGVFDASVTSELMTEQGVNARLDTWIRVCEDERSPWGPVIDDLRFASTVSVVFRMAKGVEVSDQQDDMLRLVVPLLERIDGDAVLHFQFEEVWLLRMNGELSLNEKDDLWRPQRLALLTQPFRRETHTMDFD
ncbi:SitI3 family protein [Streptomyces sp. NPDC087903]|uniref:SitI3 family protein n=1 Tax=Streptomyces sp. NPDC087903 TaxID=3365819 RepID=UPI00382020F7